MESVKPASRARAAASRRAERRRARLRPHELLGDAATSLAANFSGAWPLLAAILAVEMATYAIVRTATLEGAPPEWLSLGHMLGTTTVVAALMAALLRRLSGVRPVLRLDRSFGAFVALQLAFAVVSEGPLALLGLALRGAGVDEVTQGSVGLATALAMSLLLLYPSLRLMPWGVALAIGDPDTTLRRSWAASRLAVGPAALAALIYFLPLYAIEYVGWSVYYYTGGVLALATAAGARAAAEIVGAGLQALLYRRCITEHETLADVFS